MISHWKNKPIIINSRTLIMLKMKNIIIMSLIHIPMRKRVNLIAKSINMIISMTKKSIPMVMRKKTITITMRIVIHKKTTTTKSTRKTPMKKITSTMNMKIMTKNHFIIMNNLLSMNIIRIDCMKGNLVKI